MPFNKVLVSLTSSRIGFPVIDWDMSETLVLIKPATAPNATLIQ